MKRTLVSGILTIVGAMSLVAYAQSQAAPDKVVQIQYMPGLSNSKKLADPLKATYSTLYLLHGGGGHTLTFESDHGVVLINTKAPGWGKAIIDKLDLITQEPVTTIINTHPDLEYTGGNSEFPGATTIVAHVNTKSAMAKMAAFQGANAKFLPNKTFTDTVSLFEARNRVDLFYFGAGHTNGDAVVVIPTYSAAYLGDLFPAKATPVIDTAHGGSAVALPDTLARALVALKAADIDYVVAGKTTPVRGTQVRVMSMNDLQEYVDFNRDFLAAAKDAMQAGKSVDEAAAALKMPEKYKAYGMEQAKANIQAIYNELRK